MRTLNLGILAHVDAGKTSLTERLLYESGVIPHLGSVDDGSTQTDSLDLERQRGITIKSAVVSFTIDDPADHQGVTVNLIDTPGHPDFIAEVERVLSVLDGAVLVISSVEGVQPQTRVLMRVLRRLGIPTLIFVNKIDRRGARSDALVREIAERLDVLPVIMGTVADAGQPTATFHPYDLTAEPEITRLAEVLTEQDDGLLAAYVDDDLSGHRVRRALARQTARVAVHPVFFGSAITGAGVDQIKSAVVRLLPTPVGDEQAEPRGQVFKIDRGPAGEKIAYVRMFTGTIRTRDRLALGGWTEGKITSIRVFADGSTVRTDEVAAGRIGMVGGLGTAQVGDTVRRYAGGDAVLRSAPRPEFAPPTLETVVVPRGAADGGALHTALTQLAEQDPLINLRSHGPGALSVSLYGEVQKEVIQATLAGEYDLDVEFRETTTICIERPIGSGAAVEIIATPTNPFLAGIGLRIDPAPVDSGVDYRLEGHVLGTMPLAFFTAVEETVDETLEQGLHGWRVTDCVVSLTATGYYPRQSHAHAKFDKTMSSTAGDFRNLTPLVLMAALRQAQTQVLQPVHRFAVELPVDSLSAVLAALDSLGAVPRTPAPHGRAWLLEGEIPADAVHTLTQRLPGLTSGEGVLESGFARYLPVSGAIPSRPRTDHDPLNRKEYLLRTQRRVPGG